MVFCGCPDRSGFLSPSSKTLWLRGPAAWIGPALLAGASSSRPLLGGVSHPAASYESLLLAVTRLPCSSRLCRGRWRTKIKPRRPGTRCRPGTGARLLGGPSVKRCPGGFRPSTWKAPRSTTWQQDGCSDKRALCASGGRNFPRRTSNSRRRSGPPTPKVCRLSSRLKIPWQA